MDNRCIMCDNIIPEGVQVCKKCELKIHNRYRETPQTLIDVKRELWLIASKNAIMITNQNIDWLLDQVYRELVNENSETKNDKKSPKHPCQNCVYFNVCGDHTRTEPCNGRQTKTDVKKSQQTTDRRG